MAIFIEVAVSPETSTTEQGSLLENLGREALEASNYQVEQQVRLTGVEVDLIAKHEVTGERIFVECKARRDSLAAEVITKLLGTVYLKGVSAGWLISTSELGKDAKGIAEEWNEKPPKERRTLQLYVAENVARFLIKSSRLCDPLSLDKPSGKQCSEDTYLLITNFGRVWAVPTINVSAGMPEAVYLFDAKSGIPITDPNTVKHISTTNSTLHGLSWISADPKLPLLTSTLLEDLQNVVEVPTADDWTDYRPARPEDFVGREELQNEIFRFFEAVRDGTTKTRLLAIKSPSGWGKSSVLLKLASRCRNVRNRGKYFMYAVDCRAAVSRRYGELALKKCIDEAIADGFLPTPQKPVTLGGSNNPFSGESLQQLLSYLRKNQRTLVLFFDQFEEIFSKQDLGSLFGDLQALCAAVDSAQENIVFGFSWKTDGTVPQDHPAYHMWQNLADRRKEFSITPFNSTEVAKALSRFARQLKAPLNPQLRKILRDHCQGYPWLLKKLCIHVYRTLDAGADQADVLNRALNVEELFAKELSELPASESQCVKQIALESPAEFFQIENSYGGTTLNSLLSKRLILRSGSRLILYWDIFRDYVLTGKAPNVPVSYIPQSDAARYGRTLRLLVKQGTVTIDEIVRALGVKQSTADNVMRDLVMLGSAEANRKTGKMTALQSTELEAEQAIAKFWANHILVRHLVLSKGIGFVTNIDDVRVCLDSLYPTAAFAEKTWVAYNRRLINWLACIGAVAVKGDNVNHVAELVFGRFFSNIERYRVRSTERRFWGEAPPDRVVALLRQMVNDEPFIGNPRNSMYVLTSLGITQRNGANEELVEQPDEELERWLALRVVKAETVRITLQLCLDNPQMRPLEIGEAIASTYKLSWAPASKMRYGNSLQIWARWAAKHCPDAVSIDNAASL